MLRGLTELSRADSELFELVPFLGYPTVREYYLDQNNDPTAMLARLRIAVGRGGETI